MIERLTYKKEMPRVLVKNSDKREGVNFTSIFDDFSTPSKVALLNKSGNESLTFFKVILVLLAILFFLTTR
jgi:hypothetical protein